MINDFKKAPWSVTQILDLYTEMKRNQVIGQFANEFNWLTEENAMETESIFLNVTIDLLTIQNEDFKLYAQDDETLSDDILDSWIQ